MNSLVRPSSSPGRQLGQHLIDGSNVLGMRNLMTHSPLSVNVTDENVSRYTGSGFKAVQAILEQPSRVLSVNTQMPGDRSSTDFGKWFSRVFTRSLRVVFTSVLHKVSYCHTMFRWGISRQCPNSYHRVHTSRTVVNLRMVSKWLWRGDHPVRAYLVRNLFLPVLQNHLEHSSAILTYSVVSMWNLQRRICKNGLLFGT